MYVECSLHDIQYSHNNQVYHSKPFIEPVYSSILDWDVEARSDSNLDENQQRASGETG